MVAVVRGGCRAAETSLEIFEDIFVSGAERSEPRHRPLVVGIGSVVDGVFVAVHHGNDDGWDAEHVEQEPHHCHRQMDEPRRRVTDHAVVRREVVDAIDLGARHEREDRSAEPCVEREARMAGGKLTCDGGVGTWVGCM